MREEFKKLYEADNPETKRQAFKRNKDALIELGEIDFYDGYFWAKRDINKKIEY